MSRTYWDGKCPNCQTLTVEKEPLMRVCPNCGWRQGIGLLKPLDRYWRAVDREFLKKIKRDWSLVEFKKR